MEKTVVLIKPDGMKKKVVGKVIDYFERIGLDLIALKLISLDQKLLDTWYAHHKSKPFFPELSAFMMETPENYAGSGQENYTVFPLRFNHLAMKVFSV